MSDQQEAMRRAWAELDAIERSAGLEPTPMPAPHSTAGAKEGVMLFVGLALALYGAFSGNPLSIMLGAFFGSLPAFMAGAGGGPTESGGPR